MGWFRKKLNEEVNDIIREIDTSKEFLSEEWIWRDQKLKGLHQLEELDLEIIRKIRKLHRLVKDNPNIYNRILLLSSKLKEDLENLIKLRNLSTNIPKEKLSLAKDIVSELQILLKEEIEEERLIRGMTRRQAEKLGIEIESFYTVQGENGFRRLMSGEGDWPLSPTKAHLGTGLYAWDNIRSAEQYKENLTKNIMSNGEPKPKLFIIQVSFSKRSLRDFEPFDVDLLDNFKVDGASEWMEQHSKLWTRNAKKHDYKYVIRGVSENLGREHYFHPECLEEAAIELVA